MKRFCCVTAFLLACLLALPLCASTAERWSHFATDEDGVRHYYNPDSIKWVAEDVVRAWDKWELSGDDRGDFRRDMGREAVSVRSLVEIRCREREHRSVKIVYLGETGEEILFFDEPSAAWEPVSPGSVTESLHKAICLYGRFAI